MQLQGKERPSIASDLDNQRVFTPINGGAHRETNIDYLNEKTNKYSSGPPNGTGPKGSVKYASGGSINGGYIPSDNEVYGYAAASVRSNDRYSSRGGVRAASRPPSSLRLDVDL